MAALAGALLAPAAATSAYGTGAENLDLGPHVTRTDVGPTGYSVTFRYDAPDDVQSVRIWGDWQFSEPAAVVDLNSAQGRFGKDWRPGDIVAKPGPGFLLSDMTKGEDGVWSWTSPLPSGTYSYHFVHDDCAGPSNAGCTRILDPANPSWSHELTPTGAVPYNTVYVPENPLFTTYDYSAHAPTPPERTGTYEHREYDSPNSTSPVGKHHLVAYLPAGYDPDREVPYPTLYVSHGANGNEATWNVQGLSNFIMENLVAQGVVQPMVIVSTNHNGLAGEAGYSRDVLDNVIPFIEREYNVSTNPADRAMSGQSAGGARTLGLLYNYAPTFEYYGAWAPAAFPGLPTAAQIENVRGVKGGIHMGTGLQDFLANIAPLSLARVQTLVSAGIAVDEHNVNGDHQWQAAREMYEDFLRNVAFRATSTEVTVERTDTALRVGAAVAPLGMPNIKPTGSVEFRAHGELIGVAPLQNYGTAELVLARQSVPTGSVEARYVGGALFNPSTSSSVSVPELPDTVKPVATLVTPTTAGPFPVLSVNVDASDDRGLTRVVANIYKDGKLYKSTQTAADGAQAATHTATVTLPDGAYSIRYNASDLAGNVAQTRTFEFTIDATKPVATIKDGTSYTVKTGETYDLISFKLSDAGKIDKVELNGKVKDLTNNPWSDVNYVKPGVFGGVKGANTLVVFDVAGNTQTYTFTLN
ncbi:MAG: Ig-like domain-containing protein [Mycetocola sp.]